MSDSTQATLNQIANTVNNQPMVVETTTVTTTDKVLSGTGTVLKYAAKGVGYYFGIGLIIIGLIIAIALFVACAYTTGGAQIACIVIGVIGVLLFFLGLYLVYRVGRW